MKFERVEPTDINDYSFVRLTEMGNISEIMFSKKISFGGCIKKIDKDHYIDVRSGEIFEFEHNTSRADDKQNVAKSLKQLKNIINTNVVDVKKARWVTLTYRENMRDPKKLANDAKNAIKRLREEFGHFEYINIAEPQGRGAWHLHCIFIFDEKAPFMSNDVVFDCWKKGFVSIKKIDSVDDVGAYITAYLGDIEVDEYFDNGISDNDDLKIKHCDVELEDGTKVSKAFIKGGRLGFYPSGFNIYRCSKGIKKPVVSDMLYKNARKKIGAATPTFKKKLILSDEESDYSNELVYEYYNSIRK